ncbi:hypothetical protein PENSPDRAFT_656564 [Peniophora sp. CONT]|nr:hypothetical protein PENSPDRAFT_656564 [Peniophora sp. CONT]
MSRAGQRALTVRIGLIQTLSERKDALLSALWTPPLLSSLTLDEDSDHYTVRKVMEILASQPHAALTHLVLTCQKGGPPCSIPDVVLGDYTPRLRSLSIDCMLFDWAAIQGVCSLRISCSNSFVITCGLSDILGTLARCPLLEHLQLDLPGTLLPEPNSTIKHIVLSHIDSICLRGSNEFCDNLLDALKGLPCTTMIAISVVSDNTASSMLPSSFSHLKAHASQVNAPIIRHISLVQVSDHHASKPFQFCLSGDLGLDLSICSAFEWMNELPRRNSFVSASTTTHGDGYIDALHAIIQQWPITHVTHLDMRMFSAIDKGLWIALFGYLPTLTTVIVRPESNATTTLFDALDDHLQRSGKHIVKSIILDLARTGALIALPVSSREAFARGILRRVTSHCAAAARANAPLETIEVVNDERGYLSLFDCSEFSKGLSRGFIYGGVLYTEREKVCTVASLIK